MSCFKRCLPYFLTTRSEFLLCKRYAGHSKWQNIKHTKALKDAEKGKSFTRIGRLMKVAIHEGGSPNPDHNIKLAHIIEQGRRMSMPMATIEGIIKKTQKDLTQAKPHLFEIKGPGSSIILCETITTHLIQTKQAMAGILKKHKSKHSDSTFRHMFQHKGIIDTEIPVLEGIGTEAELMEIVTTHAIESEAEEVTLINDEDSKFLRFISDNMRFTPVQTNLEALNYKILNASVEFIPLQLVKLSDSDLEVCHRLYEKLEALDEFVNLYDNIKY